MASTRSGVAEDVDEYFARLPEDARATLEHLRKSIRAAAPKAAESISYQIPTFTFDGHRLYIAAWKKHVALYPLSPGVLHALKGERQPYKIVGSTLRIPIGWRLSAATVRRIVKAKIAEDDANAAQRGSRRGAASTKKRATATKS
jgi:uncharacterized protein YdhG (YjbR/CyaY superfamily)